MAQQVQTEPYVDLKLLECSRKSSIEVGSGNDTNNALFMNKVEEGYMLDVGDKVSIHSAVVSEIGAGGNTIELKGEYLDTVSIGNITTATTYKEPDFYLNTGYRESLLKYDAVTYNSSTFEKELTDNQVHMTLQYYKTTNGENCFSLPRLYAFDHSIKPTSVYEANDCNFEGATITQLQNGTFCESDYQRDRNASAVFSDDRLLNGELVKVRQDGTKFTLFVHYGTTYLNKDTTVPKIPDLVGVCNANGSIDPAVSSYKNYRELKTITIPAGRRSADFIAEAFTQSLQNASNLNTYEYFRTENQPSGTECYQNQGVIASTYKTDTFKPFLCANGSTFNASNFNEAVTYDDNASLGDDTGIISQERLDWVNNFTFVAFKRPDFVESGRRHWLSDIAYQGINYTYITHISDDKFGEGDYRRTTIEFDQPYDDFNCQFLSEWLKTQELYPELWDLRNASSPYHERTQVEVRAYPTKTLTNASENNILIEISDPLLDPGLTLDIPYQYVSKREITLTSASLTPNTVRVTRIETNASGDEQTIYFNGFTNAVINASVDLDFTITDTMRKPTIDNSRFLHLDMVQAFDNASKTTAVERKEFGSDMYYNPSSIAPNTSTIIKYNTHSQPLFFTYMKEDENKFYANPQYNDTIKQLSYGVFLKGPNGKIMITTESLGGIPQRYYNNSFFFIGGEEAVGNGSYNLPKYKRHIGYDPHFSAYGNAAIGLYTPSASGVNEMEANKQIGFVSMGATGATDGGELIANIDDKSRIINQVYLGSSNPKLTYDPTKDRFGFTEFYTPEYLGNNGAAGENEQSNAVVDGKALVYKVNKRLRRQNFAPGMGPYLQNASITVLRTDGTKSSTTLAVDLPNRNIYPFSIMDCQSGISIESFGITDENVWNKSLLGILGFTYEQLQSPVSASNTAQSRVNTGNLKKLNKVTTQAEIKAQDVLIYNQNIWGATMYHPNISTSFILHNHKSSKKFFQWTDPIVVDTDSLTVTAEGVPRKMLNPFFTIRSDLIDSAPYTGSADSGEKLPVMGIVNKSTDSGDYFVGGDDSIQFTMTRQKPLSTITTAITDPDGTFSRVDDNSAVIYKVVKQNQLPVNLVASLFGNQ